MVVGRTGRHRLGHAKGIIDGGRMGGWEEVGVAPSMIRGWQQLSTKHEVQGREGWACDEPRPSPLQPSADRCINYLGRRMAEGPFYVFCVLLNPFGRGERQRHPHFPKGVCLEPGCFSSLPLHWFPAVGGHCSQPQEIISHQDARPFKTFG